MTPTIQPPVQEPTKRSVSPTSPLPLPTDAPPTNWPDNVVYRTVPHWSSTIAASLRNAAQRPTSTSPRRSPDSDAPIVPSSRIPRPSPDVVIRKISDPRHPCFEHAGSGLFAAVDFEIKNLVLDYVGTVYHDVDDGEERRRHEKSDYVLRFTDALSVDAEKCGNVSRFVNDFRGIAEKPNCEFRNYWADDRPVPGQQELRIGVWTVKAIAKGEELLVSYGKSYWNSRGGIRNKWTEANALVEQEWEKRAATIAQSMGCVSSDPTNPTDVKGEEEVPPASIYQPTKEEMRKMRRYR